MAFGQQRKKEIMKTISQKKKINARCFHAALPNVGNFGNIRLFVVFDTLQTATCFLLFLPNSRIKNIITISS